MDGTPSETKERYPDSINTNSVQDSAEFQDIVMVTLFKSGVILQPFTSRKYQYEVGESIQGMEIKLDNWCTKSNRLSIEIAEKTRADIEGWTPSGIYRKDNTRFYIQGNRERFWFFSKKVLRHIYETRIRMEQPFAEHQEPPRGPTVKAFYLPVELANKYGEVFEVKG